MKKASVLCFLLLTFTCLFVKGQQDGPVTINPGDPAFREKFSQLSFEGKFYTLAVRDQVNNYYMADFTLLPGRFEKVYFINLVYTSDRIVSIDSDISQDRLWFMVNNKYTDSEAAVEFDALKEKTLATSVSLTQDEKEEWIKKNDKFKQSK